ncbi:MAG: excinuclease ABC subunit UvrA, partial [Candidatus Poribacteria bacterium]|nr:excinuclease ABC subunit UvrA [Candidatus Poribacteria bacterium]
MRETISVKGARENNLQNIDVEIPRDKLVVVTGMSGSGKSSLAFDTVYAEGQRRFLESMSTYAKRFIAQLKKPDVDFVMGLSPVVSIEQKTISMNPRSTIGTMTDLYDYMRMLFVTIGISHCRHTGVEVPIRTPHQMMERMLAMPEGTEIEIRAPVFKIYGEDYTYLFDDIRTKGYRRVRIDDKLHDISEEIELDEGKTYHIDAIVDKFVIKPDIDKQILASLENGLVIGEGFLSFHILNPEIVEHNTSAFYDGFCAGEHHIVMGEMHPRYFTFNEPESACVTCSGLGTYLQVHPDLLVPDKTRSIAGGAFVREAFNYDVDRWDGRMMYSMAQHFGFDLDAPFKDLPDEVVDFLFYGTKGEKFKVLLPEGAKQTNSRHIGREIRFDGIINRIERHYRRYRQQGTAHSGMEEYLRKVMVEHTCPDCDDTKLKGQRLLVTINGMNIYELGEMHLQELKDFLERIEIAEKKREAGTRIIKELTTRLALLIGIGLDYLNLNRRSATLSSGESQRIRLSTQIGSGLMGMLYVLDEPSIGLHPKDNAKMIDTLRQLRDIGNTVIVVEHDESTIRAADHIIELGPGPGVHGGQVIVSGPIDNILKHPESLTGLYLSGRREIELPEMRRELNGSRLMIRGAR